MPKEYLVTMETGQENASKGELDSAEEEEDAGAAADDPDDSSAADFEDKDFKLIWETPKFEKSQGQRADGSIFEQWTCLHCNGSWKKWNHTKALGHAIGGCSDIKQCKSITPRWLAIYQAISDKIYQKKNKKKKQTQLVMRSLDDKERDVIDVVSMRSGSQSPLRRSPRKHKGTDPPSASNVSALTQGSDDDVVFMGRASGKGKQPPQKKKKVYHQVPLVTAVGKNSPQAELELNVAISHFIAANSLPFSLSEDLLFKRMIAKARYVNATYRTPNRADVGGKYLEANYTAYRKAALENLSSDAEIFGISIYGDGATIDKVPQINMLGATPANPSCMLDTVDCTNHMQEGGVKDAHYIMKKFLPVMKEVDPDRELIDYITFDGAYNMQIAGQLLVEHFPRATIGTGLEHVVSLVFGRLTKISQVNAFCKFAKKVCLQCSLSATTFF